MEKTRKPFDRNFPHTERKMSVVVQSVEHEMREILPRILRGVPPKLIHKQTGATPRACKGWIDGDHLPQAHHMLMIERAYPELASEMRRLRALEAEDDWAATQLANEIVRLALERVRK